MTQPTNKELMIGLNAKFDQLLDLLTAQASTAQAAPPTAPTPPANSGIERSSGDVLTVLPGTSELSVSRGLFNRLNGLQKNGHCDVSTKRIKLVNGILGNGTQVSNTHIAGNGLVYRWNERSKRGEWFNGETLYFAVDKAKANSGVRRVTKLV